MTKIKFNSRDFWGYYGERTAYDKALKKGFEWKCLLGEEDEYCFINQESYLRCLTDPGFLLTVCAYRRSDYGDKKIGKRYEEILYDFLRSEIPVRIYQACNFIKSQEILLNIYSGIPFVFEVKNLIKFAEKIILKNEYPLLEANIKGLNECVYAHICYMIESSESFEKYGSHYKDFCKIVKQFREENPVYS